MGKPGIVFEIKQMAVFDGPGIRTTVFLKGCPLRCMWCHNPEGLSFLPQMMRAENGCLNCGRCREVCRHPEGCVSCGACVRACPKHLIHLSGTVMTAEELTERLLRDRDFLRNAGGGITFSGGEPLGQPEFLLECLERLSGIHTCTETSGYGKAQVFREAVSRLDYVIMDLKVIDGEKHQYFTGADNRIILENLEFLKRSGKPFRIRIPLIPGVNDDEENYRRTAGVLKGAKNLDFVELLPYHRTAGAKYPMVGKEYRPEFDEEKEPCMRPEIFEQAGILCRKI